MSIYKLASSIQRSFLCDITKQTGYLSYLGSKLRCLHNRCSINDYTERSHTCGQVTIDTVGQRVSLFGWVKFTRFDNKMILLRDSYGSIQCVVDKNISKSDLRKLKIPKESVLKVSGTIQRRAIEHVNLNEKNGDVEIAVDELVLINPARTDLPLLTRDTDDHTLENRLKHRHLDLRDGRMQEALRARSAIYQILRKRLVQLGFVECDTPTLYRRTPGGANEFIVPSQVDNKFYSLTQSPQQLKQLLMISGLDRYFQICRCYRDETCRTDRQPEFTQLDIELSFTNQNLVMKLVDDIIYNLLSNMNESMNMHFDLDSIFLNGSIQMMTHHEAMTNYGTDKPDLRFGWSIKNCTEGIKIEVPFNLNQELIDKVITSIKAANSDYEEFKLQSRSSLKHEDGSSLTILSVNDKSMSSRIFLGLIRSRLATELLKDGNNVFDHTHKLVWITSFPLFEMDHVSGKIQSTHHPFTAPSEETAPLLEKNPLSVIGQHYDLVLNGQEIAGGSIRNHDPHVQKFIFDNILKVDEGTFEYFIDALRGGCPPHGGIAFGMDRLIAILLNRNSIREVIAFPKSSSGRDVMTDTPHELDTATKKLYHLT